MSCVYINIMQLAPRRPGIAAVWTLITLVALTGLASLGVDYGRVQLVKTEPRRAADAAALAAATKLGDITATQTMAANYVNQNKNDESVLTLDVSQDVEFGTWNESTNTFTVLTGTARAGATAVKVTCRRTRARGNPITLSLGSLIGMPTCDVQASAVASARPLVFGVVGLDFINMTGNSSNSYWSGDGAGSFGNFGNIGSNGNIALSGSTQIAGNARPGIGKTVNAPGQVSGITTPLTAPLVYPAPDPGNAATVNNNSSVPSSFTAASSLKVSSSKTCTLPGGVYYFNNIYINGTLEFTGPATIYCTGTFDMGGQAVTSANTPTNLQIYMCRDAWGNPPGTLTVGSGAALYADIYAPEAAITLGGSGDIYGSVIGKSINMTGTSSIHYDLSLNNSGKVILVQ